MWFPKIYGRASRGQGEVVEGEASEGLKLPLGGGVLLGGQEAELDSSQLFGVYAGIDLLKIWLLIWFVDLLPSNNPYLLNPKHLNFDAMASCR